MSLIQSLAQEFRDFGPGTKARALFFLRTGAIDVSSNSLIQRKIDQFTGRIERLGPRFRERVLAEIEGRAD